jgi:hypothetical protein
MHNLSPFSLSLYASTRCWSTVVAVIVFLFLETYILQSPFLGVIILLSVHACAERIQDTNWSTSAKRIQAWCATWVNSCCSLKRLSSFVVFVETIIELILSLNCNAISPRRWSSLVHRPIDSNKRIRSGFQIISLSWVESHSSTPSKIRLSTALSIIFVMS